jgi:uncharacterized YigZ family protein
MLILKSSTPQEMMVKNSRFLSEVIAVSTPDEAREVWHQQKIKYDNGGHIVYAFITGPQGNIAGCSDDGEPSGTAGRPTLEVLKGSNLTNVILTTARWFGGTKLGTGGLVRAYTQAAQLALEAIETRELIPMASCSLQLPYSLYEQVKRIIQEVNFEITNEDFSNVISLVGTLPEKNFEFFSLQIRELSSGAIKVTLLEQ